MSYARQRTSRHRSHDSGLFRVRTESAILENLESEGEVFRSYSRTSSPIPRNYSRPSTIPPLRRDFASLGTNCAESFVMTYAVTSPVPSPVQQNFGGKKMGNNLPSPMIYSISAPVSPITEGSSNGQNPVPFLGSTLFSSGGNATSSAIPCIPTPVKVCQQMSVPQSFLPRPVTLQGTSLDFRGRNFSSFRRLSHNRIGYM